MGGERVSIHCDVEGDEVSAAQPGPLAVLHEDRDLLVLDKPPGLVVHPGAGNRDGTLLNRLLAHDPGLRAVPRAGLVHRLDKDTSGLMLVARSLAAHTRLVAQIRAREVERVYEAVVAGAPPPCGTVEAPIGRDRARRTRMAVEARGKHAVTRWRVVERYRRHARLEVTLETGRTHQIRVHLAHVGSSDRRRSDLRETPPARARRQRTGCGFDVRSSGPPCPASVAQPPDIRPHARHRERARARHDGTRPGAPRRGRRGRMTATEVGWIDADWPAPPGVRVVTTTRSGGESRASYASLNLGTGTGDAPATVARNRARLRLALGLAHEPCWLEQVHGSDVVRAARYDPVPRADASVGEPGSPPCAVLTADCLPVVLCDTSGTRVGIAHAGMARPRERSHRALRRVHGPPGPRSARLARSRHRTRIRTRSVREVRDACVAASPGALGALSPRHRRGSDRWLANLYAIAACQLESLGVGRISRRRLLHLSATGPGSSRIAATARRDGSRLSCGFPDQPNACRTASVPGIFSRRFPLDSGPGSRIYPISAPMARADARSSGSRVR